MVGWELGILVAATGLLQAVAQETNCVTDWERLMIRAVGEAVAPFTKFPEPTQAEIMAKRGARVMAYEQLAECIAGVQIGGGAKVKDAVANDQEAVSAVKAFIKGARIAKEEAMTTPTAVKGVVTLEIPLQGDRGLGGQIPPRWRADTQRTETQPPVGQTTRPALPSPPAVSPIDGLILDARGLSAYPGLYPQVLAEGGRVVYYWDGVDREHRELVGRVTNAVEKAKTLLREQGVANPILVKVVRVEGYTNYVISAEDAKKVISADLDSQFLRKSRIIFVLGL
jgi:hypothetical protein